MVNPHISPKMTQFLLQKRRPVMGLSALVAVLVLIIIVISGLVIAVGLGILNVNTNWGHHTTSSSSNQPYNLATSITGYDHFDPSTTLTVGTNFTVSWFSDVGGSFSSIGKDAATLSIQSSYQGTIYAEVSIPSGQNLYVDPALTESKNTYVTGWNYEAIGTGSADNYVFTLSNIPVTQQGAAQNSQLDFYPYFVSYAALTLNTPSAQTGIGSSSVTKFIQWQATVPTSPTNVGAEITEIQVIVNTTNAAVFQLNSVNDPATYSNTGTINAGLVKTGSWTSVQGTSTTTFTYKPASSPTDYSTGQYILYSSSDVDNFGFTLSGDYNFGASTAGATQLTVKLLVYTLAPGGSISTQETTVAMSK